MWERYNVLERVCLDLSQVILISLDIDVIRIKSNLEICQSSFLDYANDLSDENKHLIYKSS